MYKDAVLGFMEETLNRVQFFNNSKILENLYFTQPDADVN